MALTLRLRALALKFFGSGVIMTSESGFDRRTRGRNLRAGGALKSPAPARRYGDGVKTEASHNAWVLM